ncbi:MAG: cytochrome o ubiquinol oxidase subunit III, partial [Sulfobacillus thermosulfidooxidans]
MNLPVEPNATQTKLPLEFTDNHESLKILGFWSFLATDLLLFASLFAVYAVYQSRIGMAGPSPDQLFKLGPAVVETLLLLTSSFTCGLAVYEMRHGHKTGTIAWLIVTILLGIGFVTTEIREFVSYIALGDSWHHSAFLSAFFTLVGTHGAHVSFGILWAITLIIQLAGRGLTTITTRKMYMFALYWHFLDIIWVFIFTVVYLSG